MSVITSLPAVPNRVVILFRFLKEYPEGMREDELKGLLSPRALRSKENEDGQEGGTIADDVISEARQLKLIEDGPIGCVRVPAELRHLNDAGLLRHLEECLVNPELAKKLGQGQFPFSLAWFLTVDPAEGINWGDNHKQRVERECGEESKGFELTNNRRFQNMVYWARYLGYAMRFETDKSNLVIPDPTVAVERHLRVILGQHREVSIGEFLTQLGEHSPVFETGGARTAVDNMMKVNQRPADLISRSTSLALLRLERRGVVRMVASSDAPTLRLGNWPDERPVSHVVLNG